MFLRGFVGVRTHDFRARVIDAAVPPRGSAGLSILDPAAGPDIGYLARRIAPEVPLVGPKGLILIEVFRRKQIDRQCLHSFRWPRECRSIPPTATASSTLSLRRLLRCCRLCCWWCASLSPRWLQG